ncbi:VOC family protein [Luteimonas suaedae]|uniref:VOC family protein n=1 Tax=Luteimonas suaedae TaxID=2605430 RepID=UPI0011F076E8|nr:VOC family protein [Luteimonas suaedae]
MAIHFNHTIVWSRDRAASAAFLAEMLGLPAPDEFGPFRVVATDNGVNVDFADKQGVISTQHYAFLVGEPEFDEILGRIREKGLSYWADPGQHKAGEINTRDDGRGLYFKDLNGHLLEIITRPYGSGGQRP